ncbi:preprotein translocase subunit YajC [Arcanobacterium haemolyticum]|nr:preprotein translocase subunit YajC [Arcanobacterium haemolyticum]
MPQQYTMFIFIGLMVLMFWWMSRSSKKMREAAAKQREEAVQLGNNVVTTSGFFGTIVDIDGDAVTLQSPSGDETVWLKNAINAVSDLPLAENDDEDVDDHYVVDDNADLSVSSEDSSEDGTARS